MIQNNDNDVINIIAHDVSFSVLHTNIDRNKLTVKILFIIYIIVYCVSYLGLTTPEHNM